MRVELKSLQPNPFRNFNIDPIDDDRVETLKKSIKDFDFWGGILARRTKHNGIQLAFGHHRIRAAMKAGVREADIAVRDNVDDLDMIRMYAIENATQRGNTSTALAGSVAAAVQFLAKGLMTGSIVTEKFFSDFDLDKSRQHFTSGKGVGRDLVCALLQDVPEMNEGIAQAQLANLKASGEYAEIVATVKQEVEEEEREALKHLAQVERERAKAEEEQRKAEAAQAEAAERRKEAAKAERAAKEEADQKRAATEAVRAKEAQERADALAKLADRRKAEADAAIKKFDALRVTRDTAQKAADTSAGVKVTFDFEGVAKHLVNADHINTFRQLVLGDGIRPYLPVNRQGALAKKLVDGCEGELTSRYMRENIMAMVLDVKGAERRLNSEEKAEILRKDWSAKAALYQREFSQNARGMLAAAIALSSHAKNRPGGVTLHMTSEFREAVEKTERAVVLLKKAGVL